MMAITQNQRNIPAQRMYVGYSGFIGMLENGDHANFVFAFFRPHVTSMSVLNTHSQPQTTNPRIITTNQMPSNLVMQRYFSERFQDKPFVKCEKFHTDHYQGNLIRPQSGSMSVIRQSLYWFCRCSSLYNKFYGQLRFLHCCHDSTPQSGKQDHRV